MPKMLIYFSGEGSKSNPEITLQDEANIMLTFHDLQTKLTKRFKEIRRVRKQRYQERINKLAKATEDLG